ncbi:MAG: hypothetical protein AAGC77_01770 [Pseudomonadota bacterium]
MAKTVKVEHQGPLGAAWFIGWLFTVGFLKFGFWKGFLALLLWPYFLGDHFSTSNDVATDAPPENIVNEAVARI